MTTKPARKAQVIWSGAEKERVLARAIELMRANHELRPYPALMKAQRALPPGRRRQIKSLIKVQDWFLLPEDIKVRLNAEPNGFFPPTPPRSAIEFHDAAPPSDPAADETPGPAALADDAEDNTPTEATPPTEESTAMDARVTRPINEGLARAREAALHLPRVRWNPKEKDFLCEEAAMLMHEGVTKSATQALILAIKKLPMDRRRNVQATAGKQWTWFHSGLQRKTRAIAKRDMSQLQSAETTPPPAAVNGHDKAAEAAPAEAPTPQAAPVLDANVILTSVLSALGATLRQTLVNELAGIFRDAALQSGVRVVIPQATAAEPVAAPVEAGARTVAHVPAPPRAERLPILIVGLRGGQMELMKAEFGEQLDLRFHGTNDSKDQLRRMVESSAAVVGFTNFMSHSVEDIIKARAQNYIRCAGGMTQLRQTLAQISTQHRSAMTH